MRIDLAGATLYQGDCLTIMLSLPDNSVDSIVTDPPYGLSFMGKKWDHGVPAVEVWQEAMRVLKPGGHLLAFGGSRTYHRMAVAIEDAGFEIRDQIMWIYGSGFPKSMDVSKAIDKAAGAKREVVGRKAGRAAAPIADIRGGNLIGEKGRIDCSAITAPATDAAGQWEGWGTALKPAHEPICVARKPLAVKTVAGNVLAHGTGAINIDACRVGSDDGYTENRVTQGVEAGRVLNGSHGKGGLRHEASTFESSQAGRWPANVIHDGSEEVIAAFPQAPGQLADASMNSDARKSQNVYGDMRRGRGEEASADAENEGSVGFKMKPGARRLDVGSAARFFYCAKASRADRNSGLGGGSAAAVATNATMREREDADWQARNGNHHPTVKPTDLMAYLCRLVTPPGGLVLDPFMGSGSTGKACMREGFQFIGIDLDSEYVRIARARIQFEAGSPQQLELLA